MDDSRVVGACFYGYNQPGAFLWARIMPNGRVFVMADHKFQRKVIEDVAADIVQRTQALGVSKLSAIYALPEMFGEDTGQMVEAGAPRVLEPESPAETFGRCGLPMIASGSQRKHWLQRIQDFLRDAPDGRPWLIIGPDAKWLQRTLPTLVQTKTDPDDVEGEVYAVNALGALLSSRPSPVAMVKRKEPPGYMTVGWLKQQGTKTRRGALSR